MLLNTLLFVVFAGCSYADEQAAQKPKNEFVFDLFRTIAKDKLDENIAVSPYCTQLVLDFVRAGAAGETKAELDRLLEGVESVKWTETPSDSPMTAAASLWAQQGHPILPEFLKKAGEEFGASVELTDFAGNSAEAVKRINAWCSEKTQEKIPVLFEELDAAVRCVLAGVIHFAADWKVPFDEESTTDSPFTLRDGTEVKTKIMQQSGSMKYGETEETLVVELPYKDDGYSMLLLLPGSASDFAKWESEMTFEKLSVLRESMKPVQVSLRMPRFTAESVLMLNEPLKCLGMSSAFSRDADFSKIDGRTDLYLSEVRQKVFVKVNETGTEASAAAGAVMTLKGMIDVKSFYADRPFLYAIVKDNVILFLGRFVKPEVKKTFIDPGLSGAGGAFN